LEGLKAAQVQDLETRPALPEVVPPADPAVAPETAPARTEPPQPVASAPAADAPEPEPEAKPAAPPEVPDVGRPLQVQLQAVKQFWDAKAALILDAREPAEYAEGHIPGAINLPADEVIADPERLDAVDSGGRPIICYCGGGSCEVSIHLAEALVYQSGKKRVLVFMGGWPEWEAAGYPVEK
jgi:rhodanese-related sulfurtransferase